MELIDVIRGRWLALAIAAPVVAGILALTLLTSLSEQRFVATATVGVPQAIATDANQSNLRRLLEDFSNAFTSRPVAEQVSELTGRGATAIRNSADARTVGDGSEVLVTLEGREEARLDETLRSLVELSLTRLAEAELERAQVRFSAAERQLEDSLADLAAIEAEAGNTDLLNEYRQRSADVQALRTEIAREYRSPELQAQLDEVLAEKQAEADRLAALVTSWELSRNQVTEASSARDQAQRDQFGAEDVLTRVDTDAADLRVEVESTSTLAGAAIPTLGAMAVALGAVVAMAIASNRREVLDSLRDRARAARSPWSDTGPDDTGPDDTGPDDTGPDDTGPYDTRFDDTGLDDTGFDDAGVAGDSLAERLGPLTTPGGTDVHSGGAGPVGPTRPAGSAGTASADMPLPGAAQAWPLGPAASPGGAEGPGPVPGTGPAGPDIGRDTGSVRIIAGPIAAGSSASDRTAADPVVSAPGAPASGITTSGITTSGITTSGITTSGSTASGSTASGSTASGAGDPAGDVGRVDGGVTSAPATDRSPTSARPSDPAPSTPDETSVGDRSRSSRPAWETASWSDPPTAGGPDEAGDEDEDPAEAARRGRLPKPGAHGPPVWADVADRDGGRRRSATEVRPGPSSAEVDRT